MATIFVCSRECFWDEPKAFANFNREEDSMEVNTAGRIHGIIGIIGIGN